MAVEPRRRNAMNVMVISNAEFGDVTFDSDRGSWNVTRALRDCGGGPTGILVYCADYRCSHSIEMSAEQWPDDMRLSEIEPRFVCKACGKRGADVRPHFAATRMGTSA
jgi:hypothetical protein